MAARSTTAQKRISSNASQYRYQQGNTVRKYDEVQHDYYEERKYREEQEERERVRRANRRRHLMENKQSEVSLYSLSLISFGAVALVTMCILYLSLMSAVTSGSARLSTLQNQLSVLQEENDTRYNHLNDSISLEEVRDRAVNELGMVNATADQVITYADPAADYVAQNESIPR